MPTITIRPADGKDAYVNAGGGGGVNYGTSPDLRVSDFDHALVEFDLSSIPAGSKITSAELELYLHNFGSSTGANLYCYRNTASWAESTVTWNNQPSHTAADSAVISVANTGYYRWNVTAIADGWLSSAFVNYGLKVIGTSNTKIFASSDNTNWPKPALIVTYNEPPATPTLTAPNGGETWDAVHTITWTGGADPEGSATTIDIELSTDNGGSWTRIVTGTANDGAHAYDFSGEPATSTALIRVRSVDSGGVASGWDQSDAVFTIQHNTAPNAPTLVDPVDKSVSKNSPVTYDWTHNDPDGDAQARVAFVRKRGI